MHLFIVQDQTQFKIAVSLERAQLDTISLIWFTPGDFKVHRYNRHYL